MYDQFELEEKIVESRESIQKKISKKSQKWHWNDADQND